MKPSKFAGHPPRPTKGTLTTLAKQQTAKNESADVRETQQENAIREHAESIGKNEVAKLDSVLTEKAKGQEESTEVAAEKAAPTEAKPAPAPKAPDLYCLGKKYSPKTDRNSETWGKITKALADGPKSMKELAEAIKGHGDFMGYMTRGGHIVPYVPTEEKTAAVS